MLDPELLTEVTPQQATGNNSSVTRPRIKSSSLINRQSPLCDSEFNKDKSETPTNGSFA